MPTKSSFDRTIEKIHSSSPRFAPEAYHFLCDALSYCLDKNASKSNEERKHIDGAGFMNGLREYALEEFGPMVPTVFEEWNVHTTDDFGAMVFELIEHGEFERQESDRLEDFCGVYDFRTAFVEPFLPKGKASSERAAI